LVSVDTDLFFTPDESRITFDQLKKLDVEVYHHEIQSIHGHDAFLIEYDQLESLLDPIFSKCKAKIA
ncbi:MAG: homoserine acetyltransferase, partial [Flavobacteriaceae bacterium]|nr:homoserine acetyltransferase [Flavobacteriaceae bacterium]